MTGGWLQDRSDGMTEVSGVVLLMLEVGTSGWRDSGTECNKKSCWS